MKTPAQLPKMAEPKASPPSLAEAPARAMPGEAREEGYDEQMHELLARRATAKARVQPKLQTGYAELVGMAQQGLAKMPAGTNKNIIQRQVSFPSAGPGVVDEEEKQSESITRSKQAKHAYGLECLGASLMYIIQSYGLVPPEMSRVEFEHAFTMLTPPAHGSPKTGYIKVGGKEQTGALPVDLFSKAFEGTTTPGKVNTSVGYVTKTEATLRGADWGGFAPAVALQKLPAVLKAFDEQSKKPGYEFMRAHRPVTERFKPGDKDQWTATEELNSNSIDDEYFKKGNTLLAELCLKYPATPGVGHRCVIVGKAKYTLKNHFLYPADDPWYGSTLVMVPPDIDGSLAKDVSLGFTVDDPRDGSMKYNAQKVFQLAQGKAHVFRRKAGP